MARTRSAILRGAAAAAGLCLALHAARAFVAPPAASARTEELRGTAVHSAVQLGATQSPTLAASAATAAAAAPGAFSGSTLLTAGLFTARSMVSVCAQVARHAKAPVSEFGAPSGVRNFQEMALGFTTDIAKNNLGESFYRPWVPFVTTIFLFIFVSNWSGALIPWKLFEIPAGELAAPTNNINTTVALSLLTSLAYFGGALCSKDMRAPRYVQDPPCRRTSSPSPPSSPLPPPHVAGGLAKKGLGYFARYVKPTPILLPLGSP